MKTLYNIVQQYEGILDPNQDQVMDRMTDEMIRRRIQEYCTYSRAKRLHGECWIAANPYIKNIRVDKDEKGWYIETASAGSVYTALSTNIKSFYEYCLSKGQKIDKQKGFLIEDIGVYFRWYKHIGGLTVLDTPNLESTDGLPEELDILSLGNCCQKSKRLDVSNKIKVIAPVNIDDLKISGNGCKNVIIDPDRPCGNITIPSGVKMYKPKDWNEYVITLTKLSEY